MERVKLTLPKKAPPQAEAETQAEPQEQPRPALAERVRAARQGQEDEPLQDVAADANSVAVPVAVFQRMRELAALGEQVEAGAYKPAAVVDQAVRQVAQLHLAMQHRGGLGSTVPRSPRVEPAAEAEVAPVGTMAAYAAALRRRPR